MLRDLFLMACLTITLVVGCTGQQQQTVRPSAAADDSLVLAKKIRDAMTTPELMKLDLESGLRRQRQSEVVLPTFKTLVAQGAVAENAIWQLVSDSDDSVSQTSVAMLGSSYLTNDWKKLPWDIVNQVHIPIFERALTLDDPFVRGMASGLLGDIAPMYLESGDRLMHSLSNLRALKEDSDIEVRSVAYAASNMILATVATKAPNETTRQTASQALEQLQQEKKW